MKRDAVTPELRMRVLLRDRACVAYRLGWEHECRDRWGTPHFPTDVEKLSIEHVHEGGGMMGRRAPSDAQHLVALCYGLNMGPPPKELRQKLREYLAAVDPAA